MDDFGLEKVFSWVLVGCTGLFTATALFNFQPTTESTQVISNHGITYSNNSYYIKNKTKLDKVDADNFSKKPTSNKNLNNKIRLTSTKGTILPVSKLTATQYVYHK